MKTKLWCFSIAATITSVTPTAADTIYSGILDTAIPTDYAGTTVNINGGTLNLFFGGVGVANNGLFQPARIGTGGLDTIISFSLGAVIDGGIVLSSGSGGSIDHVGNTFTAGQEAYLGFQVNGSNYGWMRVVFTNNSGGALVRDWAYDNSGSAIVTGRVEQSVAVANEQTFTLSPATGESFTLGSQINDNGSDINSVIKIGGGTTTLTGTNNYTGTTSVNEGTLVVTGSIGNTAVTVSNVGSTLATGATGIIGNNLTINDGADLAAGGAGAAGTATVNGSTTFNNGSIFSWDINSDGSNYDRLVSSSLAGEVAEGSAIFQIVTADSSLSDTFWSTSQTWTDIFTNDGSTAITDWASLFNISIGDNEFNAFTPVNGSFSISGNTLTWSAVPEPTSILAGLVVAAGLLRRRRNRQ